MSRVNQKAMTVDNMLNRNEVYQTYRAMIHTKQFIRHKVDAFGYFLFFVHSKTIHQ